MSSPPKMAPSSTTSTSNTTSYLSSRSSDLIDSSSSSSSLPPNPLYIMLQDMKKAQAEGKSLREITAELCARLSPEELATLEQYTTDNNLCQVGEFFSGQQTEAVCTIASSHVFVRRDALCVPAEIGLVKMSFRDGITGRFDSLFDPLKENILMGDILAVDLSQHQHGISIFDAGDVNLVEVLSEIHQILHRGSDQHSGVGWVFINDDEFTQTRDVLLWCQARSNQLELGLVWNIRCVPLSSVCKYLAIRFVIEPFDIDQVMRDFTLEEEEEDAHHFCHIHASTRNVNCAILRANHYARGLYEMFEAQFNQLARV